MLISANILVYGFYNKNNLGDDLFADAFKHLFPDCNFTFTSKITKAQLNVDAVFLGGGSFIDQSLKIDDNALSLLKTKPILYIGIGAETNIHESHIDLLKLAKLIAIRSNVNLDIISKLNATVIVIPDLVYSLPVKCNPVKTKSVLYIPNISVVPKWNSEHWKHTSWEFFKIEMAQALDTMKVDFLPFSTNLKLNDKNAGIEIINRMNSNPNILDIQDSFNTMPFNQIIDLIGSYELVITQRFHGYILSHIAKTKCLTIHHHDKLKNVSGNKLSYYSANKNLILEHIDIIKNNEDILPIDSNIFEDLKNKVENALCWGQK